MAAKPHIWKGSTQLQERPDSPEIDNSADELRIVRRFEGPYETARSQAPDPGDEMAGFPGIVVSSTRVTRQSGKRGLLTITASIDRSSDDQQGPSNPNAPIYEIEWVRISKNIESHPIFADLMPDEINDIKAAVNNPTKGMSPAFPQGAQLKLYIKLLRGQEAYDVWAPLIRSTTYHYTRPVTGNCGMRSNPPFSPGGSWKFIKTADSARRENRRWTRSQEWTGADEIDEDLYP